MLNSDSSCIYTSLGVFNPSRWKIKSLEIWIHMKPNASSNLFKYFNFSKACWGLSSFPIVTYADLCCNTQSTYLPSNPSNWKVQGSIVSKQLNSPFCSFRSSTIMLNSLINMHTIFNLKVNQLCRDLIPCKISNSTGSSRWIETHSERILNEK